VRAALRADGALISGRGVALSDFVNALPARTTLASDGELHRTRRGVLMRPMMPSALGEVRATVERLADELVARLTGRGGFDGVADFARHLPVAVVSHLVGLPEEGRERMLEWAAATFDALGPANARAERAGPLVLEMARYAGEVDPARLAPGGWAARLFAAASEGRLDPEDARGLLVDYIAPSLDTTILGTGHLLYLLGRHPEQYEKLRSDPALIPGAVHEALRFGSPVRAFTRFAAADYETGEVSIPAGARALILYGSANRDERRYADPDRFDVTRDARDHLAFGHGVHRCAGGHLAQLELESLLHALLRRVRRIEVGEPELLLSNMLCGWRSFPARFEAAA
jgi:cytochrome P450